MTYVYRGNIFASRGQMPIAASEYRRALAINPNNATAQQGLAMAQARGARCWIGVNALYLIPGALAAPRSISVICFARWPQLITQNRVLRLHESRRRVPIWFRRAFTHVPLPVRATNRPARLIYEQTALAMEARQHRIDVMFNPGFTAPAFPGLPERHGVSRPAT